MVLNNVPWFLPVVTSFAMSLLHLVFRRAGRRARSWLSLAGGALVLAGCIMLLSEGGFRQPPTLSILFAILISLISFLSLSYSQWYNPESSFVYDFLVFLFLGAMNGVVLAPSFIRMYIFWEIMTVSSFFLVLFNNTAESRRASIKYILMTGTGSILLLFGILGLSFMGESLVWKHLFFFSVLAGTGIKAGIVPLHTWLPDAHPAAPTPVSAMLSGVMIKTGIYAFIRFYFFVFKPSWSLGWESILMLIGILTLLGGVFMALVQHDLKRLLAYHSISQVGYIFLGIACGTGMGLAGALYHTINHAVFKSLLFFGAGVLIKATGSRRLEDYGGLAGQLPLTFSMMAVAALAISGVPPFNGFVSKWIIFQALLSKGSGMAVLALAAALLGSVLTLASFVKVLNDSFLGVRRSLIPFAGKERSPFMIFPMLFLGAACFFLGLFPGLVCEKIIPGSLCPDLSTIRMASFFGWTAILLFGVIAFLVKKNPGRARYGGTFVGGERLSPDEMAFDGSHFYGTIRDMEPVRSFYRADGEGLLDLYRLAEKGLPAAGSFFKFLGIRWIEALYAGGGRVLNKWVERLKLMQNGLLARYIIWIFAGVILLMEVIRR